MEPAVLKAAQSRYSVAYEAYQQAAKRIVEKFAKGEIPTGQEIEDEAKAIEQLAAARRELLDLLLRLAPGRN